MLQNIREHTQGWIASIVGVILCIAFALWGVEYYINFSDKDAYVAKVNGKKITLAQLDLDYKRLSTHMAELLGPQSLSNQTIQRQLKNQALQNLITQEVLIQAANRAGYSVSSYLVTGMIRQMPEFKENNHFSAERFQQVLSSMGYSKQDFIADMRQTYLLNQVASGVIGTAFALPNEVDNIIELTEQTRDFIYYRIPLEKYSNSIVVDDKQINQYYAQHKMDFIKPEKVQIEYIELNPDELKKNIKVSDQEIMDYYQANFSKNKSPSVDHMKAKIIQALIQQKIEQNFSALNDKLTELTFTNPNSLLPAAEALGIEIKHSEFFSKQGGSSSITKNAKVIQSAFSSEVLRNGINSNLIELSPGHMMVLRIKNHEVEGILPLSEVREKIVGHLKKQLATEKTKAEGEEILKIIHENDDITKTFKQHKLEHVSKLHIPRSNKEMDQEILQAAFSLPHPNGKKSTIKGFNLMNGDYVIVVLNTVHNKPAAEISKQQKENYKKRITENNGKLEYNLYIANQMSHAKIKVRKISEKAEEN